MAAALVRVRAPAQGGCHKKEDSRMTANPKPPSNTVYIMRAFVPLVFIRMCMTCFRHLVRNYIAPYWKYIPSMSYLGFGKPTTANIY